MRGLRLAGTVVLGFAVLLAAGCGESAPDSGWASRVRRIFGCGPTTEQAAQQAAQQTAGTAPSAESLSPVAGPAVGPYLFKLIENQAYRDSWMGLFKGMAAVPLWIQRFNEVGEGVVSPAAMIRMGGVSYFLCVLCEPNNCERSRIKVLFAPDGTDAWGLLTAGDARTWLNNPDDARKAALLSDE